jgi:hypothetical protein
MVTLDLPQLGKRRLKVIKTEQQKSLALAHGGDMVTVIVDDIANPQAVSEIQQITLDALPLARAGALLLGLAFVVAAAAVATRGRPERFLIGADNRYSNSQVQLALWFTAVAAGYAAAVAVRSRWGIDFIGGVGLPENLLVLTGLSALSFGGAKVITARKVAAGTYGHAKVLQP